MAQSTTTTRVSLKLLIDTKGKRVLYAEAGKDFVDFLFHILALPVGAVISLVREQKMVFSLANLYESLENLNASFIQTNKTKDIFLKPVPPAFYTPVPLLTLNSAAPPTVNKTIYTCRNHLHYYSHDSSTACPTCFCPMTTPLAYRAPPSAAKPAHGCDEGGVVKDLVTYMVMDDLVVTPLSTTSIITLLNKFNVKDVTALEEKVVHFGMDEAVKLLNAALQSTKVLTDVFFKGVPIKSEDPK